MHDRKIRQNPDCFCSCRVYGFILRTRNGEQLRQFDPESNRNVGFLADDAAMFDGQQRKFTFQRSSFQRAIHGPCGLGAARGGGW